MLTEWRQVQNSTYRKQEVVADLGSWKADLLSRQWQLQNVVVNPIGGLIAAVMKKTDDPTAAVYLKVYTPFGSLVAESKWTYNCCVVVKGRWITCREFVFVFQDGVIRVFGTSCYTKPYAYTALKKQVRLCGISDRGVLLVAADNQVVWFDLGTKETVPWKIPPAGGGGGASGVVALGAGVGVKSPAPIKFVDVYRDHNDETYGLLITGEGAVFQIWQSGCRQIKFTSSGAETTSSVFVSYSFSHSGTFAAFATDDGFLVIANLKSLSLNGADPASFGTTIGLTVSVVSTPTLVAEQMVWLGDHCVGISARTPTLSNPQQSCLFIGGPQSKWIDLLFSTPVILVGGADLKYLCYSALGVIQYAEVETLKTFSPGSCHAASMICFALDDQGSVSEPDLGRFEAAGGGAQSSDWDEDTCDEVKRLEESMRKRLSDSRLTEKQDLNYLFFRKKWATKRRRRKENDAIGFIASLSVNERLQTLAVLLIAIKYEYSTKNIILALRSIRLVLQNLREDLHKPPPAPLVPPAAPESKPSLSSVDFSRYFRLIRDFRVIHRITESVEALLTYEDFLTLRLSSLIDLCQRDYKLCSDICATYNLKLHCSPSSTFNLSSASLTSAGALRAADLQTALEQIGQYVDIQKSKLMLYTLINSLTDSGRGEGTKSQRSNDRGPDLLASCVADLLRPSKFDSASLEGIRSAAWACLKYNKKELGCKILKAHEHTKHVLLYYYRLIDDAKEILRYALEHDDTDCLEYALYLQCQNIFNAFSNKTVPARFHLNHFSSMLLEIEETAAAARAGDIESVKSAQTISSVKGGGRSLGRNDPVDDHDASSFYQASPHLVESFLVKRFMQNGQAATDLPNNSAVVLFQKLNSDVAKIFDETQPNASANTGAATSAANAGSSFLSNLINPRSFIKDNKKVQIQKAVTEIRKSAVFLDQRKRLNIFMDCKQGYMDYVDFIEFQNINKTNIKPTVKELIVSLMIKNQEPQLKEAAAKFQIPALTLRLWKLECLAINNLWPIFCECAIQSIRSVSVEARLKRLSAAVPASGSTAFNIFSLNNPFNAGGRGSQDDGIVSRLMRSNPANDGQGSSSFSGIIGSVLMNKTDHMAGSFIPLLPASTTASANGVAADMYCPNSLPVSSFGPVAVVDYVAIAASFEKDNLALCLAPYISSTTLREKWCQKLGLRGPSDQFARNAMLCAASRSGKVGMEGNYQLFIQTVKKAIEDKKTAKCTENGAYGRNMTEDAMP